MITVLVYYHSSDTRKVRKLGLI